MLQRMHDWGKEKLLCVFHGRKGQGITEYAVILGIVVLIAVALTKDEGLEKKVTALYTQIATSVSNITTKLTPGS